MNDAGCSAGLFITGTDTGVGKTHVTCMIARQLRARGVRVGAYKPVCSGAIPAPAAKSTLTIGEATGLLPEYLWDDVQRLWGAVDGSWPLEIICPQRFIAPLAPPIAARLEGRSVDQELLIAGAKQFHGADLLLIEGAGGWLAPLTELSTVADLAAEMQYPILIVARTGLGTINHTLLTIQSIRKRQLRIAGVILNESTPMSSDQSSRTNGEEIEARSGVPVLGMIPFGDELDLHRHGYPVTINWQLLANKL